MRERRASNNMRIKDAMHDITPRTAGLVFDLSHGEDSKHLSTNSRANIKAVELVSTLLDSFSLPMRPRLEYYGMIKNAVDANGRINDGIIRIGAVIRTMMGHKTQVDIPVIVRANKLLEPAIFFYDSAPFVMCKQALEDLIKRGSLEKNSQFRRMFSPPNGEGGVSRERIHNLEHMFSPGPRNPFNFRRQYSKKTASTDYLVSPPIPYDTFMNGIESLGWISGISNVGTYINNGRTYLNVSINDDNGDIVALTRYGNQPAAADMIDIITNEFNVDVISEHEDAYYDMMDDQTSKEAQIWPNRPEKMQFMPSTDWREIFNPGYSVYLNEDPSKLYAITDTVEQAKQLLEERGAAGYIVDKATGQRVTAQHKGEPRKRTNIDVETARPELWDHDVQDEMLDPAERRRNDLYGIGSEVVLTEDVQARQRGGKHFVIPSGERGKILKDMEGDGKMLYVDFKEMQVTMPVPKRMLRNAALINIKAYSTPDFVENTYMMNDHGIYYLGAKITIEVPDDYEPDETNYMTGFVLYKENQWQPWSMDEHSRKVADFLNQEGWSIHSTTDATQIAEDEVYWSKSAASTSQVENEVKAMLREGYSNVDIKEAIKRKYPEQADEVLSSLG